jgi:hypothetical protein
MNDDCTVAGDDVGNVLNLHDSRCGEYECLHVVLRCSSSVVYAVTLVAWC